MAEADDGNAALKGRHIIQGILTLKSPLSLRSGKTRTFKRTDKKAASGSNSEQQSIEYAEVALDHDGRPYIPGSSLKGLLHGWSAAHIKDADADETEEERKKWRASSQWKALEGLFGDGPRGWRKPANESQANVDPDGDQIALGGKAEFLDAFMVPESDNEPPPNGGSGDKNKPLRYRAQTAIDPLTRTAKDTSLRQSQYVRAGRRFKVSIIADHLSHNERALLLQALQAFNDEDGKALRLGGNSGEGNGVAAWEVTRIFHLTPAVIARWLSRAEPLHWTSMLYDEAIVSAATVDHKAAAEFAEDDFTLQAAHGALTLDLTLEFNTPFLVADSLDDEGNRRKDTSAEGDPDQVPMITRDGKGWLPGSSLRGALRAQAERILATVWPGNSSDDKKARQQRAAMIARIFGSQGQSSRLTVSHFIEQPKADDGALSCRQKQDFVAIDRFTGGAKDGAKFQIEHLDRPAMTGSISLDLAPRKDQLTPADIGLLALLARDFCEGDVTLGHGTRKGYGAFAVSLTKPSVTLSGAARTALQEFCPALGNLPNELTLPLNETVKDVLRQCVATLLNDAPNKDTADAA